MTVPLDWAAPSVLTRVQGVASALLEALRLATRREVRFVIARSRSQDHARRMSLRRPLLPVVALIAGSITALVIGLPAAPAAAASAPTGQCADANLRVRVHADPEGGGAGQRLSDVDFQNVGTRSCELRGTPGVSLVGHGNGTQLGRPADRGESGTPPVVRIRPGQSARTSLEYSYVDQHGGDYSATACKPVKADGYRIYPPHSYRSVFVRFPQYACSSTKIHWGGIGYLRSRTVGCTTTSATIPAGATRKKIADVDGDLQPDTEWITSTRFGITTASKATTSVKPTVAGGSYPGALSFVLRNTSTALTVIAGSRDAQLFRFNVATCSLKPVLNKQGHQYGFDLTGAYGNGVACTDPDGNGVDQITGTRLSRPLGSLTDGDTDTVASTVISIHGLHATNGATRTHTYTWPADKKQLDAAATITCHGASINRTGITAHRA